MSQANTSLERRYDATASVLARALSASSVSSHVVELGDVSLSFGEKQVLEALSLVVDPQQRLVIIGQSGAGKTTILRLIIGILQPTKGSVFFEGQDISRLARPALEQIRTRIGMVYQDAALLSSLTVRENLALPLQELTDKTPAEIDKMVDEKLNLVEMADDGGLLPF
jgi:phospholipid/cholesterol/gamma-HCH transport system ATP-binding protein